MKLELVVHGPLISLQSFIFLLSLSLSRSLVGRLCWFRRWLLCLDRGADGSARFVFAAEGLVGFDGAAGGSSGFLGAADGELLSYHTLVIW